MIAKVIFGLVVIALVSADSDTLEYTATLNLKSNYEFGSTKKEFQVDYPGIENPSGTVKIKIMKDDGTDVHEYTVTETTEPKSYFFGLENADAGKYKVKICDGTRCGKETKAQGEIKEDTQNPKASCYRIKVDPITLKAKDENKVNFEVELERVGHFASASDLENAPKYKKVKTNCPNGGEPCYLKNTREVYVGLMFDLTKCKPFVEYTFYKWLAKTENFVKASEEDQEAYKTALQNKEVTIAGQYCDRKYLLTNNVHIMKKDTKEVLYRFKEALSKDAAPWLAGKYVFEKDAKKIPVEMQKAVSLQSGEYIMWTAICLTDKDTNDSTFCMNPLPKNFTVE